MKSESVQSLQYTRTLNGRSKSQAGQDGGLQAGFQTADYVSAHEPGCLTYQLSVGEGDPDSLIIFERYTSKQYLEEVHWQSEPFKCFGAKVREADLWESKEVTKLHEELPGAFGFMAR
ncbi:ABM domain-containing protein, partial [Haematococcus lacustris]